MRRFTLANYRLSTGRVTRWLGLLLLLLTCALPGEAADIDYLAALQARAAELDLAQSTDWLALGLYAPNFLGRGRSGMVDSNAFYFAADGKTNPQAELLATLAAFFAPATAEPDEHPQCLRIARYRWLKAQLDFDPTRLPEQPCPAFDQWITEVNPGQITLIFPAAYLNNPSSMFGHTLIRVDPPGQKPDSRLNSYAVNFAADHLGEQGPIFALKGLTGNYQGYFSLLHYYDKVKQYSDLENRDIWEYELTLSPERAKKILELLWDLDRQPIDYYFFTTNCSYVLLVLLNIAEPERRWMDRFRFYAVPIDTVRAVLESEGVLARAEFRPSARTRIEEMRRRMSPPQQALALRLSEGSLALDAAELQLLTVGDRARILELAQSHLQYRLQTGDVSGDAAKTRSLALLSARAAIDDPDTSAAGNDAPPPPVRPDQGHDTERLSIGGGMLGSRPFAELGLRAVYHDLLDPSAGFVEGAAITFGEARVRFFAGEPPLPESITAVSIRSLAPRDAFFQPISWQARIGADRLRKDADDTGDLTFVASAGAGPAWALQDDTVLVSPQAKAMLFAGRNWPENRIAGVGPVLRAIWNPLPGWRWEAGLGAAFVVGSEERSTMFQATLGQGIRLHRNFALRLKAGLFNDGDETFGEWSSVLQWYF